jgi:hypothetical protein
MDLGASLSLIALGAILEFALPSHIGPVQIGTIGIILMAVGAIGLAVTIMILRPRRGSAIPLDRDDEVLEERRIVGRRHPW